MNLFSEFKNVSDNAIDQLAGRFKDLPRPLLAAIGAGDLAVEQLAKLREQVSEKFGNGGGMPSGDDVKSFASEFPDRAQKVAGDVARQMEEFAQAAPEKMQRLIGELPAKASELGEQLSPENLRSTLDAYTQTVGNIYGTLADRGGETVAKVREHGDDGTEAATAEPGATTKGATKSGSTKSRTAQPGATTKGATKSGSTKSRTAKSGAAKTGTTRSRTAKTGTSTRRTSTRSSSTPADPGSAKPTRPGSASSASAES